MPNYGVIDLGSNSVRLCVYEVKDDTKIHYIKKDFRTLLNNKAMAGLSAHVENGAFTERGIERAIDVLRGHNKRLKYFDCKRIDVFATAVLRNATNSTEVVHTIEEAIGFPITILSEEDEAHLGFIGAASGQELDQGTLIDIGGGSTELTRIRRGKDSDNTSIAQGSLSSYSQSVIGILPTTGEVDEIASAFRKNLSYLPHPHRYRHERFYAIGGSLRAAAKVYSELFSPGNKPDILSIADFDRLIGYCLEHPDEYAHLALRAAPDRIHTVIPGCVIARTLMKDFGGIELSLCKNGLREGYLIERVLLDKR